MAHHPPLIILVHGLWMTGLEMSLMAYRLRRLGYRTRRFRYPSTKHPIGENSDALAGFVRQLTAGGEPPHRIHLVCHSLGGLVALNMLHRHPELPVGRIVALGSPFQGSWAAKFLVKIPPFRSLLGESMIGALAGGGPERIPMGRHMGVIAGDVVKRFHILFWGMDRPNDNTVAVSETKLDGVRDRTELTVNHLGLILSRPVVQLTDRFIRTQSFTQESVSDDP